MDQDQVNKSVADSTHTSDRSSSKNIACTLSEDAMRYTGAYLNNFNGDMVLIELKDDKLILSERGWDDRYTLSLCKNVDNDEGHTQLPVMGSLEVIEAEIQATRLRFKKAEFDPFVGFDFVNGSVTTLLWHSGEERPDLTPLKQDGKLTVPAKLRYNKIFGVSRLLDLPLELRTMIFKHALTTSELTLELYQQPETGNYQISHVTDCISTNVGSDHHGTGGSPQPVNQLQYVCKQFAVESKKLELGCNRITMDGWLFHDLQRFSRESIKAAKRGKLREQNAARLAWLQDVQTIELTGAFTLRDCPDENILHGILYFADDHPHINLRVRVEGIDLSFNRGLMGFASFVFMIKEAMRGVRRPDFVRPGDNKFVDNWRRTKSIDFVNNPRVRFFPCDEWDPQRVRHCAKSGKGDYLAKLRSHFGDDRDRLVAWVKECYDQGI